MKKGKFKDNYDILCEIIKSINDAPDEKLWDPEFYKEMWDKFTLVLGWRLQTPITKSQAELLDDKTSIARQFINALYITLKNHWEAKNKDKDLTEFYKMMGEYEKG